MGTDTTPARLVIERFGGVRPMARALAEATGETVAASTVQGWAKRGRIPVGRQASVLAAARARGVSLSAPDFLLARGVEEGADEKIELLDVRQMAEADRLTVAAGVSGERLMEAAGAGIARIVLSRFDRAPVVVMCGPGNNGGDGFVIARHLARAGWPVRVAALGEVAKLTGDAALHARRWIGRGRSARKVGTLGPRSLDGAGLVVDALFGAGLARPLDGAAREAVLSLDTRQVPVVAVDLPSGISGDTGEIVGADEGGVAVRATLTVTFFRKKPGHILYPGREHCGALQVIDIGIEAGVLGRLVPTSFENRPPLWRTCFPRPTADSHKYTRGQTVVCGGAEMTGAGRLAARAALRAGAGIVTVAAPSGKLAAYSRDTAAVLTTPVDRPGDLARYLADPRRRAVLAGPGLGVGKATRLLARTALGLGKFVCLDADAITSFADWPPGLFDAVRENAAMGGVAVLTPHAGEFARLFPDLARKPRLAAAREAAERSAAVVVLKGPDTVIAAPCARAAINANAPPWLATAGSGDVLGGVIAGLLAQGMEAFEAAAAAVWIHGEAAKKFGPGLIADDLPDLLPGVLRDIGPTG